MAGTTTVPVTVAYFYRIRWGGQAEFVELFERNHWPVLREQLASGRFLDVHAYAPRFHGDGRSDWTFMVTITYRDWAAMEAHSEAEIVARLFPDRERHAAEERRRFELVEAHWDVPLEEHDLSLGEHDLSEPDPRVRSERRGGHRAMMAPMSDVSPPTGPTAAADAVSPPASGLLGDSGPRGDPGLPRPDAILGFYGPGTTMWRINREAVLLGAGPAALLLQIAHPLVAEGVAQHSDFQSDPSARLRRTLPRPWPWCSATVRRPSEPSGVSTGSTPRSGARHDPDARTLAGTRLPRMDPDLLLWVQVTLVVDERPGLRALGRAPRRCRSRGALGRGPRGRSVPWHPARGEPVRLAGARGLLAADAGPRWPDPSPRPPGAWRLDRPAAHPGASSADRRPARHAWAGSAPGADPLGLRHPLGAGRAQRPGGRRRRAPGVGGADAAGLARDATGARGRPARSPRHRVGTIHRTRPPGADCPCLSQDLSRRAVVTGLGAVTPIGNDHPTFWRNLEAGVSGGGPITSFDASAYDVRIAAEVKDFDPTVAMDRKMARRMSRFIHLAMAAGKEAVADSGLDFSDWSPSVAIASRSASTPAAAGWTRSSTVPRLRARRAPTRSARSPSPPSRARWPPASSR